MISPQREEPRPKPPKREHGGQPKPRPEGEREHPKGPNEFDPHRRRDYRGDDGDAADPQRKGPGT